VWSVTDTNREEEKRSGGGGEKRARCVGGKGSCYAIRIAPPNGEKKLEEAEGGQRERESQRDVVMFGSKEY